MPAGTVLLMDFFCFLQKVAGPNLHPMQVEAEDKFGQNENFSLKLKWARNYFIWHSRWNILLQFQLCFKA